MIRPSFYAGRKMIGTRELIWHPRRWVPLDGLSGLPEIMGPSYKYWTLQKDPFIDLFLLLSFYTSTKSWRGYIFITVCTCVRVSESVCQWTKAPIWTRFSLNGCLRHWLGPYWNWWPWVKGQGHNDVIPIFSSWFSVNFSTLYLSSRMFDQTENWKMKIALY